ncbi:MAG: hypothetical protein HKN45_02990, partial [Flavobacteriales bacterium]|nr:hypothetical protein [Flavobacteriales bacterium]
LSACGGTSQLENDDDLDQQVGTWKTKLAKCSNKDHLDVVFYNVENLFDTQNDPLKNDDDFTPNGRNEWSKGRYEKKLINLSRVIQSIDHGAGNAAIIGLAEVENRAVVENLANTILPNGYGVVHQESPDQRGIDLALLYRKDMIKRLDEEFIRIEFSEQGYTSRDILYFKGQLNDETIYVFVNHWPSRRGGQKETEHRRLDAARTLKKRVEKLQRKDQDAQIIILGDFNDYPDNKSLTSVLKAKPKNSKSKRELVNLAYELEMQDKGTYPYKGDWGMLDQGIISDNLMDGIGLNICEETLEIHWKEFFLFYDKKYKEYKPNKTYGGPKYYGGYSDHLPIVLHFKTN